MPLLVQNPGLEIARNCMHGVDKFITVDYLLVSAKIFTQVIIDLRP